MQLTNKHNISLSLAVWLGEDTYDYDPTPNVISATTLIKPIRQTILKSRVEPQNYVVDIADRIASSMGTSLHEGVENAWMKGNFKKTLTQLGYAKSLVNRLIVNPTENDLVAYPDCVPVYMEKRSHRKINGYVVSGKFDFVGNGVLEDIKSTGVYSYMQGNKNEDYRLQGSIYKWLNPNIITSDYMYIQYIFTDWSKLRSMVEAKKGYPQTKVLAVKIPLMSIEEITQWITDKINTLDQLKDKPQEELPLCTKEELWQGDTVFKYYKDPTKTARATKNFTEYHLAHERFIKDGSIGVIKEIKGRVRACTYCAAFDVCTQKNDLIFDGSLVIDEGAI